MPFLFPKISITRGFFNYLYNHPKIYINNIFFYYIYNIYFGASMGHAHTTRPVGYRFAIRQQCVWLSLRDTPTLMPDNVQFRLNTLTNIIQSFRRHRVVRQTAGFQIMGQFTDRYAKQVRKCRGIHIPFFLTHQAKFS